MEVKYDIYPKKSRNRTHEIDGQNISMPTILKNHYNQPIEGS